MSVPPADDKDWTWVLERACPECGFDASAAGRDDLVPLVARVGGRWAEAWRGAVRPRDRPEPLVWSPLEYACHVRDVLDLAVYRTSLMRDEDDPVFANWDQDVTAVESDYAGTDPSVVAPALAVATDAYVTVLSGLPDDAWDRPGRRSNGSVFTVDSFTRYVLHDLVHHLTDVTGDRWVPAT